MITQRVRDCIRCGQPVEPPYGTCVYYVAKVERDGPLCMTCVPLQNTSNFFRAGLWPLPGEKSAQPDEE